MIFAIQISLLVLLAFVPTWAGGQAMKCYDQGHIKEESHILDMLLA